MNPGLTELMATPVLVHLAVILCCWLYYLGRDYAEEKTSGKNRIYRCQVCEQVYLDARDVPMARCTRCGTLNEVVRT